MSGIFTWRSACRIWSITILSNLVYVLSWWWTGKLISCWRSRPRSVHRRRRSARLRLRLWRWRLHSRRPGCWPRSIRRWIRFCWVRRRWAVIVSRASGCPWWWVWCPERRFGLQIIILWFICEISTSVIWGLL